ncbi:MAG: phytanoyl-CoA dioxygenase family protein [Chlamydiae bacterium]|nr:phytanoyl-CoA dioxygenase family protein [Chlamydiota bacterium]
MHKYSLYFLLPLTCAFGEETDYGFLSQEEITLFHQQGYLMKRSCLSHEEQKQLEEAISKAIDRALQAIAHTYPVVEEEQIVHLDGSRVVYRRNKENIVSIARINGCSGLEPSLQEFSCSHKMLKTFFALLGTHDLEHIISQIHPKLPGDGIAFSAHRDIQFRKSFDPDWQDVLENGSYAICILPIDPMTPDNGGLWIDTSSYFLDHTSSNDSSKTWIYAEPGDLLFLHPYILHGSGPNLSRTESRRTLLTGFCAFGANHRAYPGTMINIHFHQKEDGSVESSPAPWSQETFIGPGIGH